MWKRLAFPHSTIIITLSTEKRQFLYKKKVGRHFFTKCLPTEYPAFLSADKIEFAFSVVKAVKVYPINDKLIGVFAFPIGQIFD